MLNGKWGAAPCQRKKMAIQTAISIHHCPSKASQREHGGIPYRRVRKDRIPLSMRESAGKE
jgi:hypothetical protein